MDNEQRFIVRMCSIVVAGLVLISTVIGGSCSYQYYKTAEVIKSGVDPVAAKYAFSSTSVQEDALAWMSTRCQPTAEGEK